MIGLLLLLESMLTWVLEVGSDRTTTTTNREYAYLDFGGGK